VLLCLPALLEGQGCPDFVVHASTLLDGRGNVMKNAVVQICGDRISAIGAPPAGTRAREINLSGFTLMPGWIDTHVHMAGHFDRSGRVADASEPPQEAMLGVVANAWATLEAGFTTVQSVGSPIDAAVRDAVNSGAIPGPRILQRWYPLTSRPAIRRRSAPKSAKTCRTEPTW
jgi:imidazolonepropionase-like amidohydrolase